MNKVTQSLLKYLARNARPMFESYGLLRTAKVYNKTALAWDPGPENVVVLAPHMDDETIGCGGTLARHVQAGATVRVVFLTDGRQGANATMVGLTDEARASQEAELVRTRRNEARSALDTLGIHEVDFFDAPDGELTENTEMASGPLRKILQRARPDLVYLPFFLEQHPDHSATTRVLLEATRDSNLNFTCCSYEVWTPLFPNCLVKIDAQMELKRKAIACYDSQLHGSNYVHTALGLNAYRSSAFINDYAKYVEAFSCVPLAELRRLYNSYGQACA
ncbi:MAG TPA: PIG-L family deacetylase, partial [Steroidobacteraceae bacterium]|nr:PIG-L family deacetylase [Steroidobacteraceae bacterium]